MELQTDRLFDAFLALENRDEVRDFLSDVLSETELERLQARWLLWELLAEGLPQTEVSERTGLSRVTVGRAARVLRRGTGMIRTVLGRLDIGIVGTITARQAF